MNTINIIQVCSRLLLILAILRSCTCTLNHLMYLMPSWLQLRGSRRCRVCRSSFSSRSLRHSSSSSSSSATSAPPRATRCASSWRRARQWSVSPSYVLSHIANVNVFWTSAYLLICSALPADDRRDFRRQLQRPHEGPCARGWLGPGSAVDLPGVCRARCFSHLHVPRIVPLIVLR